MRDFTPEEEKTNQATQDHINVVAGLLNMMRSELSKRAVSHDQSKLSNPELATFVKFTPKLKGSEFGSDEYKGFLREMQPALDHHFSIHRHHPEHFVDEPDLDKRNEILETGEGINQMNLIDILECLLDWKAASQRHATGDIMKSIDLNTKRFGLSDQLVKVLQNTVKDFDLA